MDKLFDRSISFLLGILFTLGLVYIFMPQTNEVDIGVFNGTANITLVVDNAIMTQNLQEGEIYTFTTTKDNMVSNKGNFIGVKR